jgi:hypothetical protein
MESIMRKMKFGILLVFAVLALVGTVSAFAPITFPYDGKLVITYVSSSAGYNNEFGIDQPEHHSLGFIHGDTPAVFGTEYTSIGRCSVNENVVVYITTPIKPQDPDGPRTYYSDALGVGDNFDHALVTPNAGSFNVAFEDIYGGGDKDYNDVVLNVACTPDTIPTPEFPTLALPAGLIIGMLGVALFIQKTKEV